MSIMTANDSVKVMQDFSGDRDELLRTLDQLMSDSGPESGAADADQQLTRLHTAVNMLGSMQGKKAVVYFSMPSTRNDSLELRPLIDAAIRANVAFYSVDARGLILPFPETNRAYTIGAQDVLQIRVAQQQGVSGTYSVRPDGKISVPMIGEIRAVGLTTVQLEAVIVDRLETDGIADHPSVTVAVAAVHNHQ
jgi:VWFA-related protein